MGSPGHCGATTSLWGCKHHGSNPCPLLPQSLSSCISTLRWTVLGERGMLFCLGTRACDLMRSDMSTSYPEPEWTAESKRNPVIQQNIILRYPWGKAMERKYVDLQSCFPIGSCVTAQMCIFHLSISLLTQHTIKRMHALHPTIPTQVWRYSQKLRLLKLSYENEIQI